MAVSRAIVDVITTAGIMTTIAIGMATAIGNGTMGMGTAMAMAMAIVTTGANKDRYERAS